MISYGFSQRQDGDMRIAANREALLTKEHLDKNLLVLAQQTHSTNVSIVTSADYLRKVADVDGLLLLQSQEDSSFVLGIRTADCVPILFIDRKKDRIGAAHSGWKGTLGNISREVITQMVENGSDTMNIEVILGPHIHQCCYEVPEARALLFNNLYGSVGLRKNASTYTLSLKEIITTQLKGCGITDSHIFDESECTSCHTDRYFSYRKETKESFGEQLGFIAISR